MEGTLASAAGPTPHGKPRDHRRRRGGEDAPGPRALGHGSKRPGGQKAPRRSGRLPNIVENNVAAGVAGPAPVERKVEAMRRILLPYKQRVLDSVSPWATPSDDEYELEIELE